MPDSNTAYILTRADELNAIGAKLFGQGDIDPARLHFLAALSIEPNNPQALQNLGAVLRQMNHFAAAESVSRRSVKLSNNNPFCRSNLGVSQLNLKKFDAAYETLKSVVEDLPDNPSSWHNYGLVLYMTDRRQEAYDAFTKSLALMANNPQCESDQALALLSLGRIQDGLAAYECRWKLLQKPKGWHETVPEWQGEDLRNRHILLHHEQGFGDGLMLVRFVNNLPKDCKITLAVPSELVKLFARSFPRVVVVDWNEEDLKTRTDFDYQSPLLSVMRWLNISKPVDISSAPYLVPQPMANVRLPAGPIRIGICWASGNHNAALTERRRVVPVTSFLPLTEIPGVSLISLQKDAAAGDICANGMEGLIYDVSPRLEDFAATADIMSYLDLIISVDSAVAHVAGAIGKPCLMLAPYSYCWRWWDLPTGLPWYRDMYQYEQAPDGTWDAAMCAVVHDVTDMVHIGE